MATQNAPRPADDTPNPTDTGDERAGVQRWIAEQVAKAPPPPPLIITSIVSVLTSRRFTVALGH